MIFSTENSTLWLMFFPKNQQFFSTSRFLKNTGLDIQVILNLYKIRSFIKTHSANGNNRNTFSDDLTFFEKVWHCLCFAYVCILGQSIF